MSFCVEKQHQKQLDYAVRDPVFNYEQLCTEHFRGFSQRPRTFVSIEGQVSHQLYNIESDLPDASFCVMLMLHALALNSGRLMCVVRVLGQSFNSVTIFGMSKVTQNFSHTYATYRSLIFIALRLTYQNTYLHFLPWRTSVGDSGADLGP